MDMCNTTARRTAIPLTSGRYKRAALRSALVLLAVAVSGCGALPTLRESTNLYSLSAPSAESIAGPTVSWQLLVDTMNAPAGLDTTSIAVRQRTSSLDYYEGVAWTDRAPVMMQRLLVETLENTGLITGVGRDSLAIRANFVLRCELRDFQADTTGTNTTMATVRTSCALINMPDREIVARESHSGQATAGGTEFAQIVAAFNRATDDALTDIAQWALSAGDREFSG